MSLHGPDRYDLFPPECGVSGSGGMICPACGGSQFRSKHLVERFPLQECRSCGLQLLSPAPSEAVLNTVYTDYHSAWYVGQIEPEVSEMKRATFAGYLDRIAPFRASGTLLDVGCASGELMTVARDRGFDVYGVEISSAGVERCKGLFGAEKVIGRRLQRDDFPAAFFDVIVLSDVLEHVPVLREFVAMLECMLRPQGLLLIVTPDTTSWTRTLLGRSWPHYKREHLYYFNRTNLTVLFSDRHETLAVEPARKVLTLNYVVNVLQSYPASFTSQLLVRMIRVVPKRLRSHAFTLSIGEMLLLLRKRT